MARKKKKEEHVNHERWLVSYADFITLLFAFFTSLYAISTVDARKAGKMVFSTRAAFNVDFFPSDKPVLGFSNPDNPKEDIKVSVPKERMVQDKKKITSTPDGVLKVKDLHAAFQELSKAVEAEKASGVNIRRVKNGVIISLKSAVFFDPGKGDLRRESLRTLDYLAQNILRTHLDVRVEGHTDESPAAHSRYRSNWELSTARAVSVVRYFMEQYAYPPESLSVAGFASTRPLDPNELSHAVNNRRVDIVLITPHRDDPMAGSGEGGEVHEDSRGR